MSGGIQVDALPHKTEVCSSRKGLKVFAQEDGSVDGFCFACGTYVPDPYGDGRTADGVELPKRKTEAEIAEEMAEIDGYQVLSVPSRKLKEKTLEQFDARVSVSEVDGVTPTALYWPVVRGGSKVGYYVKPLSKKANQYFLGNTKDSDPFNWIECKSSGAYRLIITEGPEDMASVRQMYDTYGKEDFRPAICSLPNGAGSVKKILSRLGKEMQNLFKEIILCFDDDEAGHKAVQEALLLLPGAKSVTLPFKDANECIIQGAAKAAYNVLAYRAQAPKNTRLVYAESLHEAAREPASYGEWTWPWPKMNKLLRGLRTQETIYLGAAPKMGKGEIRNTIAAHLIKNHKEKIFLASPEENNKKTYKLLAGKLEGRIFHDPDVSFDYEAYDRAGTTLKDHCVMLDLYQHMGWESLRKDIIAAASWGARVHFIDPITNLTNGMDPGAANTKLQEVAQDISALAMDLNISVFLFCHLKAGEGNIGVETREKRYKEGHYIGLGNCSHSFGGDVYADQFAGSRAMARSCNMMIGLEGNKDPNLPEETRNVRRLKVLEDREYGAVGTFDLFWNKDTGRFTEI